jgi:uncharacterized protein
MSTVLAPVSGKERIGLMDALRGFAILGIFIANLGSGFSFYNPEKLHTGPFFSNWDSTMALLHHIFIEGKFYSIFSFLFGWGIALQLQRSEASGREPVAFVRRRLFFMLLLGLCHLILIWPGDIVAFYSLVGFLLLWMRKWKEKNLLITAIILILSPILLYYLKMQFKELVGPTDLLFKTGNKIDESLNHFGPDTDFFARYRMVSYFELVRFNLAGFFYRFGDLFFQSRISKVLGLFIIGYLVGQKGRYQQIINNPKLLWSVAIGGLLIGLPSNYILGHYMEADQGDYYGLKIKGWYRTIAYTFGVAPLAMAYISLFFLMARNAFFSRIINVFQPVGKMAFSNYIFQSIVGIFTFFGVGFAMLGQVGPVYYTLFAVLVYIAQSILSRIWLHYFRFGPLEWLWRSATYGSWQGIRK